MTSEDSGPDPTRLVALSDGVFAIAITVLVLNVDVPSDRTTVVTTSVIVDEWRDVFSYVLSFLVVGNFWVDHRRVFEHVTVHTGRVTWLNMVFLMTVAFLPYPTSLLGDYGGVVAVVFYAAAMTTTGTLLYALWWYVSRGEGHLVTGIEPRRVRHYQWRYLLTPLVFGVSIPIALLFGQTAAFVCWASLFGLSLGLRRYTPTAGSRFDW